MAAVIDVLRAAAAYVGEDAEIERWDDGRFVCGVIVATPIATYTIQSRIAGRDAPWQGEGSGDRYTDREAAEIAVREPANEDGQPLEYRLIEE